eukprot:TRINITY_DN17750_c0_g1_i2.p1 TRINITY_DN17750_c0_g1~~TRINITY_DN17750_c0_g1_i2.p1  ORF type:complete len:420 (+),score=134.06 TRINITY_DN17750_c0_g1_i2:54-1262(+)
MAAWWDLSTGSEWGGLLLVFISGLLYSVQSVFVQWLKAEGVPPHQALFVRGVLQGVALAVWLTSRGLPLLGPKGIKLWVALRGAMGGFAFMALFHAVSVMPIGDATALFTLHPVVVVLVARVALKEPIQPLMLVAIAASLVGMFLVTQPSFLFGDDAGPEEAGLAGSGVYSRTAGIVAALFTSLLSGCIIVLIKYTSNRQAITAQQLFPWSVAGVVASLLMHFFAAPFVLPSFKAAGLIAATVAVGTLGHWFMNFGTQRAPSAQASLVRTLDIVYGYIFDVVLFDRYPSVLTMVGVGLILFGIAMIAATRMSAQCQRIEVSPHADAKKPPPVAEEVEMTLLPDSDAGNDGGDFGAAAADDSFCSVPIPDVLHSGKKQKAKALSNMSMNKSPNDKSMNKLVVI